ncbi:hypothetical protein SDC9_159435 [bioreactor metagenome]|uniref:Uncharacterized protein n=1 Tax=bioreactor metagenome TaxID=1076179 RepID=A0A645FIQ5_9ZZZZ
MSQTTGKVAYQGIGQGHEFSGNSGVVHDGSCGDEEGDCHQGDAFRRRDKSLYDNVDRNIWVKDEVGDDRNDQGEGAGEAKHEADGKDG